MAESSKTRGSSSKSSAKNASGSNGKSTRRRVAHAVGEKAQDVINKDYDEAKAMAADAMKSRAYLYPIKGLVYFLSNRALWRPLTSQLLPFAALSIGVTTAMFVVAYIPQLAVLMVVNGPLAVFTTVLLIFSESSAIISIVARMWLLREALLDTFDATLVARRQTSIVAEGRELRAGGDPMMRLGRISKSPFQRFSLAAAVRYLLYLPLNFIPVVGTIIFILIRGRNRGRMCHDRYFQLKTWTAPQRTRWVETHAGSYTSFGMVAALLELIPILSMLFTFTNAVGAALWAADLEDRTSGLTKETAPNLRQRAENAAKEE